jgi:hypothetical protein
MKLFLATLSLLLATANVSSALSVPVVVCSDDDGTVYKSAKEVQPGMFAATIHGSVVGDTVLLLSCDTGRRVNILNVGHPLYETLEQLQGFIDSDQIYTFEDITKIFNEDGLETSIEAFDTNSCICGNDTEVTE